MYTYREREIQPLGTTAEQNSGEIQHYDPIKIRILHRAKSYRVMSTYIYLPFNKYHITS